MVAGDNYVAEHPGAAVAEILALVEDRWSRISSSRGPPSSPGGTAWRAARCAEAAQARLGVPAVTGMHPENPGVELYRRRVHVAVTDADGARMLDETRRLEIAASPNACP